MDKFKKNLMQGIRKKKNGCWLWWKSVDQGGYGKMTITLNPGIYKIVTAHRLSYEIHKGTIPKNKYVCHTCDIRRCINPDHLFLGTAKQNIQDAVKKKRMIPHCVKLTLKKVEEIRIKYKTGNYTHRSLAIEYEVSKSTIWDVLRYNHWIPETPFRRPRKYTGKINFKKAQEIREKYKKGTITQGKLASEFGLCQQTVCDIIHHKIYSPFP